MCGGYLSFAGLENKARYAMTPIADVLPVDMLNWDDRMEHPEGVTPVVTKADHPVLKGIDNSAWPEFLGYNRIMAKDEADEIATIDGDTFMAAGIMVRAGPLPLLPTSRRTGARRNSWIGKVMRSCSTIF